MDLGRPGFQLAARQFLYFVEGSAIRFEGKIGVRPLAPDTHVIMRIFHHNIESKSVGHNLDNCLVCSQTPTRTAYSDDGSIGVLVRAGDLKSRYHGQRFHYIMASSRNLVAANIQVS